MDGLPPLGLNRLLGFEERLAIEEAIEMSFGDIYSALDDAHFEARELEKLLKRIFVGSATEDRGNR